MFEKMKQMYELQKKAKEIQRKLEEIKVEESDSGIKIQVNGIFKVEFLEIAPEFLAPDKKEKLESILCKLFSKAVQEVQKKSALESQNLLKGFSFPG